MSRETREIVRGIVRVHAANMGQFRADPNGDNPRCKNALGTYLCERCGRNVLVMRDACPMVPREERWSIVFT